MRFTPTELTQEELDLQQEVREFLAEELPPGSHEPCLGMAARKDKDFSLKMAARGWVGMALPKEWGGSDRTAVGLRVSAVWLPDLTGALVFRAAHQDRPGSDRYLDVLGGSLNPI